MCGICGIWGERNHDAVASMVAAMRHRGPDDHGIYVGPNAVLGMARLSILDLTPAAHQPMSTPDGLIWIVYNGEMYNFKEQRKMLADGGCSFASNSDTEVVLRLYERYGDDFLLRLQGMFALAIYDQRGGMGSERLLLARDHLGIKPLLYSQCSAQILFASELKALLASGLLPREIDPVALRQLLTYGSVTQPHSMLRNVQMLPPAHRLIFEHGHQRLERYWRFGIDRCTGLREQSYEEQVIEVAGILEESVRRQLVSDVPVGAFLSGGVDSSLLVAMMARLTGKRVNTYSVGFEAEGASIDESDDARRTAAFLGTEHTEVIVRGQDVAEHLTHIASALDQPSVDGVNSYFVSKAARQDVTVAISGTGGDELFAGYPWFISMVLYRHERKAAFWHWLAESFLANLASMPVFNPLLAGRGGVRLAQIRQRSGFVAQYANTYQIFGPQGAAHLLDPRLRKQAQAGCPPPTDMQSFDELACGSAIERVTSLCLRGYTTNQLLRDIDAVSMAHSLEVRVPFLDTRVVDIALSLPASAKLGDLSCLDRPEIGTYRETGAKRILIDAGRHLLPPDFDNQPKRGFAMPFTAWLRGPLREILEDTLSVTQVTNRGWFDPEAVNSVKRRFIDGQLDWSQPWLLMILELWCRAVLDAPVERLTADTLE